MVLETYFKNVKENEKIKEVAIQGTWDLFLVFSSYLGYTCMIK